MHKNVSQGPRCGVRYSAVSHLGPLPDFGLHPSGVAERGSARCHLGAGFPGGLVGCHVAARGASVRISSTGCSPREIWGRLPGIP